MTDFNRRDLLRLSSLLFGGSLSACGGGGSSAAAISAGGDVSVLPATGTQADTGASAQQLPPYQPTPTPPPVASNGARQVRLISAAQGSLPFCVGFAFKRGDIPAGSGITVVGANAQAAVKNRWSDGSAKFALIAGHYESAGSAVAVVLEPGAASAGVNLTVADLLALMTQPVTIQAGSIGSASWSGADWSNPFMQWVSGPRMSSWVYRKPVGNDPHLVAWLEVRLYAGGLVEVLPWIENGHLMVAGPTSKHQTYSFTMGGTLRFSASIDLPHHCRTPLVSGAMVSHWLGTSHDVVAKHDSDYLMGTGLVPSYGARTPVTAAAVADLPSSYTPLQRGGFPVGMGAGGYSNSIGLLPEWDVVHLTSEATTTYKSVIFQSYSAGRYGLIYRDETATPAHRPARVSQYQSLTIKWPTSSTHAGWPVPPQTSGTEPQGWATSHHPSVGYLAYLLTGWSYHLETLQFANTVHSLGEPWPQRDRTLGVWRTTTAGATRHVAWSLRTLAQCLALTPDDDTAFKAEYQGQYVANINYYHGRYVAQAHNPFGFVTPYSDYSNRTPVIAAGASTTVIPCQPGQLGGAPYALSVDGQYVGQALTIGTETRTISTYSAASETLTVSSPFSSAPAAGVVAGVNDNICFDGLWMGDFFIAALGYAKDLDLGLGTSDQAKFDAFYAWKARSVIGRLGSTGATEFLYRNYAMYNIAVAPFDSPGGIPANDPRWNTGSGPWFSDWGAIYNATFSGRNDPYSGYAPYRAPGPRVDGPIRDYLNPQFPAAEALPAIAYAVKHGLAGAGEGYARLTSASNWAEFRTALDAEPVWAVAPGVFVR